MNSVVLDASAVLAALYGEPGSDRVDEVLATALVSSVNAAEVISKLTERGMAPERAVTALGATGATVVAFDLEQATLVGALRPPTRIAGLSLGDRACLALAKLRALPAMTGDAAWAGVAGAIGVEVALIRESH